MRVVCLDAVQGSSHVRAKLLDAVNGTEYEDKGGDWMLVVDTPWKRAPSNHSPTSPNSSIIIIAVK
jgi:hypothetical protein